MAVDQVLLDAIAEVLPFADFSLGKQTNDRAYEAFILALCQQAVREAVDGQAAAHTIGGGPAPFVFRGRYGAINSEARNYGYFACTLGNLQFEIHLSLQIEGKSSVKHEVDVSFISAEAAATCRDQEEPSYPTHDDLIGAWECKCFLGHHSLAEPLEDDDLNKVGMDMARQFVGVLVDMGYYRVAGLASLGPTGAGVGTYLAYMAQRQLFAGLMPDNVVEIESFKNHVVQFLGGHAENGA